MQTGFEIVDYWQCCKNSKKNKFVSSFSEIESIYEYYFKITLSATLRTGLAVCVTITIIISQFSTNDLAFK